MGRDLAAVRTGFFLVLLRDFLLPLAMRELLFPWEDFREETFFLPDLERDFLAELLDDLPFDCFLLDEVEALEVLEDFPPPARMEATCTDPFCRLVWAFPLLVRVVLDSRFLEETTLREEAFLDLVDRDTFLLLLDFFRV